MADLREKYKEDSVTKRIVLTDGEVTLTGDNIYSENFEIEQVLCDSEQLKIGKCNAAKLTMRINCTAKGNPTYTLGTAISCSTTEGVVAGYILKRTLSGIQALKDVYESKGKENYSYNVNGKNASLIKLKKRINTLVRTVDETRSEIERVETSVTNANLISYENSVVTGEDGGRTSDYIEVDRTLAYVFQWWGKCPAGEEGKIVTVGYDSSKNRIGGLPMPILYDPENDIKYFKQVYDFSGSSFLSMRYIKITWPEFGNPTKVKLEKGSKTTEWTPCATDMVTTEQMNSAITQKANEITLNASETYETKSDAGTQYKSLSSRISLSAHTITLGVENKENNTQAGITITLKDEKGNDISTGVGTINLNGLVTFTNLTTEGQTSINGANLQTGTVTADNIRAETTISNHITAQNIDITGGSVKIAGNVTDRDHYIYLTGVDGTVARQAGLTPFELFATNGTGGSAGMSPALISVMQSYQGGDGSTQTGIGSLAVASSGKVILTGNGDGVYIGSPLLATEYNIYVGSWNPTSGNFGGDIILNLDGVEVSLKQFVKDRL